LPKSKVQIHKVEISPDNFQTLVVSKNQDPMLAAMSFTRKHGLDAKKMSTMVPNLYTGLGHITELTQEYAEDKEEEEEI
jgi:hypothetical protein